MAKTLRQLDVGRKFPSFTGVKIIFEKHPFGGDRRIPKSQTFRLQQSK